MKLSKSILSPIRATRNGGPISLSFLSRRLRSSGSLKNGQASPFFTTTSKKRGSGFENPEPSSPKVTCIGQVRVKSKKKVKQCSKRRIGEVSFRKIEQSSQGDNVSSRPQRHYQQQPQESLPNKNQRWVLLPISVCEALRAFGAEFSCLFPCKSSCFSTRERGKAGKNNGCYADENGCGAVLTRWLMSVNDGEGVKRREIELVVGGGDEEEETPERMSSFRSSRRHVFDDIEVKDDRIEVKGQSLEREKEQEQEQEEEEARVSICIPPKNALLLMRCRSDPIKMAALGNQISWDPIKHENEEIKEEEDEVRGSSCEGKDNIILVAKEDEILNDQEEQEIQNEAETHLEIEEKEQEIEKEALVEEEKEEIESNMSSFEALLDQESPSCHLSSSAEAIESNEVTSEEAVIEKETEKSTTSEKDTTFESNQEAAQEKPESRKTHQEDELEAGRNQENQELVRERESPVLPECLLLMMCEPKLSMEVSKETWVRGTDFIRWLPERPKKPAKPTKTTGCDHEPVKKRPSIDSKPKPTLPPPPAKKNDHQPPRSSCSLPAASMVTMIEQKLVNGGTCEPFVLTRCKSEPMKTAAAKLMPETCSRKDAGLKLEPNRRSTVGVGAAGVGF